MTIQDLPGHKYLKNTVTLPLTCTAPNARSESGYTLAPGASAGECRSGQLYTHAVNRAAVRSPQGCINPGIKHTELVES